MFRSFSLLVAVILIGLVPAQATAQCHIEEKGAQKTICIRPIFSDILATCDQLYTNPADVELVANQINRMFVRYCRRSVGDLIADKEDDLSRGYGCKQYSGIYRGERVYWGSCDQ